MKNSLLAITRNIIPYVKELREVTGSVTASILMQQLEFWFHKKGKEFYKFLEPSNHEDYREGDSWCEELAFSKKEFRTAFEQIGLRYQSIKDFHREEDKFKGKLYASYRDRTTYKTYYVRNHEKVDAVLTELLTMQSSLKKSSGETQKINRNTPETRRKHLSTQTALTYVPNGNLRKLPKGTYIKEEHILPTYITNSSLNPSSLEKTEIGGEEIKIINLKNKPASSARASIKSSLPVERKEFEKNSKAISMLETWDEIVKEGQGTSYLQEKRQEALLYALNSYFSDDLGKWEEFCKNITSSKFLMGETDSKFSIKIDWVLKPEVTEKIIEGSYTLGDREVWPNKFGEKEQEVIKTHETKALKLLQDKTLGWENSLKPCFFRKVYNLGEGRELQLLLRKEGFDHPQIQEKFKAWKNELVERSERKEKENKIPIVNSELYINPIKAPSIMKEEPLFSKGSSIVTKAEANLRKKVKTAAPILESDFKKVFEIRVLQKEEGDEFFEVWKTNDYKWCDNIFKERYEQWKQGILTSKEGNADKGSSLEKTSSNVLTPQTKAPEKKTPWKMIKEKEQDLIEKIICHKVKEKDYKEVLELRIKEGVEGSADYKLFKLYGWGSKAGFDKMLEDYKQRMATKSKKYHNNPETLALFSINKYEKAELGYLVE